jgi:hypothetical protein
VFLKLSITLLSLLCQKNLFIAKYRKGQFLRTLREKYLKKNVKAGQIDVKKLIKIKIVNLM